MSAIRCKLVGLGVVSLAVMFAVVPASPTGAVYGGGGGGVSQRAESLPEAPRIHFAQPITEHAAKTHVLLARRSDFTMENEIPLQDFLRYVQDQTASGEGEPGVSIYVDPIALLEAERTLQSPVTLSLRDVPISKALELTLRQLELAYRVDPEGFVTIVSAETEDLDDPMAYLLDEIHALREEIAALRTTVEASSKAQTGLPQSGQSGGDQK